MIIRIKARETKSLVILEVLLEIMIRVKMMMIIQFIKIKTLLAATLRQLNLLAAEA